MTSPTQIEPAALARFEANVYRSPLGCWLWRGKLTSHGYGRISWCGRIGYAHRFSHLIHKGPIPDGLDVDHVCRIRACVNPAHLEAVTPRENLLRSPDTIATRNAAKTHCPQGHPLSGENLRVRTVAGHARRDCLTCARRCARERAARARVLRAA